MPAQVLSSLPSQLARVLVVDDENGRNTMLLLWRRVVSWSALRPGEHQIPHDGRQHDGFWSDTYRTIMIFQLGEVQTGSEPDSFILVAIQLQPTGCTPDCYVWYTNRQTCPYCNKVVRSAAGILLSIVGVQVWLQVWLLVWLCLMWLYVWTAVKWYPPYMQWIPMDPGRIMRNTAVNWKIDSLTVIDHSRRTGTSWKKSWSLSNFYLKNSKYYF